MLELGWVRVAHRVDSLGVGYEYYGYPKLRNLWLNNSVSVDAKLINTQALERADRNDQNLTKIPDTPTGQTGWAQRGFAKT